MSDFEEKIKDLNNTADYTENFDKKDIEDNKVMAILAYLFLLVLVPLFAAKNSKFAQFHSGQGVILAAIELAGWLVFGLLAIIPFVRWVFIALGSLVSLVCLVFAIVGIVNVVNGKAKELPIIGKFRIFK